MPGLIFSENQISQLTAKLDKRHVKQREGSNGVMLDYIEGWHAIAEANRIFGFDGWTRETVMLQCVSEREYVNKKGKQLYDATYICRVRISLVAPNSDIKIFRDGTGAGNGPSNTMGEAHESAIKEAETDAMKRALMTFGNPFGLALYDKQKKDVENLAAQEVQAKVKRPDVSATYRPITPASPGPILPVPNSDDAPSWNFWAKHVYTAINRAVAMDDKLAWYDANKNPLDHLRTSIQGGEDTYLKINDLLGVSNESQ